MRTLRGVAIATSLPLAFGVASAEAVPGIPTEVISPPPKAPGSPTLDNLGPIARQCVIDQLSLPAGAMQLYQPLGSAVLRGVSKVWGIPPACAEQSVAVTTYITPTRLDSSDFIMRHMTGQKRPIAIVHGTETKNVAFSTETDRNLNCGPGYNDRIGSIATNFITAPTTDGRTYTEFSKTFVRIAPKYLIRNGKVVRNGYHQPVSSGC